MADLAPVLAIFLSMLIPIVAIVGGITAGIIKSNGRRRLIELAQRERIAAIERGVDPDRLPPLHLPAEFFEAGLTFYQRQKRRSQALLIWGLVLLMFGAAVVTAVGMLDHERSKGAPGLVFVGIGFALLLSGYLVRPSADDARQDALAPAAPVGPRV